MKWQTINRHANQVEKQRNALRAGGKPFKRITRPKGMETREFLRRKRLLKYHEEQLKIKLTIYLLQ